MPSQIKKHVGLCTVKLSTSVGLLSVIAFFQAFRSLFFRLPKFILKSKKLKEHNQFAFKLECGYCKLEYLWGYAAATACMVLLSQ